MRYPPSSHRGRPGHVWRAILIAYACGSSGTAATGLPDCRTVLRGFAIDSELVARSTVERRIVSCLKRLAVGHMKNDILGILSFLFFRSLGYAALSSNHVTQLTCLVTRE